MSCHVDDVFHFEGEPQRCLYCLDPLVFRIPEDAPVAHSRVECAACGLAYEPGLLRESGTEWILSNPDRFHIDRLDISDMSHPGPVPHVVIVDLDAARSVLAERGDL